MHEFTQLLYEKLLPLKDEAHAKAAAAYMKNKFEFLGMYTQQRRLVTQAYIKEIGIMPFEEMELVVKDLWQQPYREFQYVALELMQFHKKQMQPACLALYEYCVVNKSWWDTVDTIFSHLIGPYFLKFSANKLAITQGWNNSSNIWLQRCSIMFQKTYKEKTDEQLLEKYILNCCHSKEFFVQKAIGWALREYRKTNKQWVLTFVKKYDHQLPNLSIREALIRMKDE